MLMCDMTDGERESVRELNRFWLPEAAELVELLPLQSLALLRMPDGNMRVSRLGDEPDPTVDLLAELERQVREMGRFLAIARGEKALEYLDVGISDEGTDIEVVLAKALDIVEAAGARVGWTCPSCRLRFGDPQPVCPACGSDA